MGKFKPNEPCPCKSGKKYKVCCKGKDTTIDSNGNTVKLCGHSYESVAIENTDTCPEVREIMNDLQMRYPAAKLVDVTKLITSEKAYRALQLRRISSNWIMVAERTIENETVFKSRIAETDAEDTNIMVLYHGHFRTFAEEDYMQIVASLNSMDNISILAANTSATATSAPDEIPELTNLSEN